MKPSETTGLIDNIYKYIQTNIEIAKVEIEERIEAVIKKLIIGTILMILVSTFLVFLLLTLALFLNHVFKSSYLGFLTITIILAILSGIVLYIAKELLKPTPLAKIEENDSETIFYEN
jgi:uncharacterized membrane protein YqjE